MADDVDTEMQESTTRNGDDYHPSGDTTQPRRSTASTRGDIAPDGDESRRLAPASDSLKNIRKHYGYLSASVEEIWASTEGTNYRAWDTLVHEIAYVQAPVPAPGASRPISLLSVFPKTSFHEKLYSKAFQVTRRRSKIWKPQSDLPPGLDPNFSEWRVRVSTDKKILDSKDVQRLGGKVPQASQDFAFQQALTFEEVERVRHALRIVCEHCPMSPGHWADEKMHADLIGRAVLEAFVPRPGLLQLPDIFGTKNSAGTTIRYTLPGTFQPGDGMSHTKAKRIDFHRDELSGVSRVPQISTAFAPPTSQFETISLATRHDHRLIEAVRWISSIVHGTVTSDTALELRVRLCKEILGVQVMRDQQPNVADTFYRSEALFTVTRTATGFQLGPSTAVQADTSSELNTITVPLTADAVFRTIEAGEREFLQRGDVILAWRKACQRADFEHTLVLESKTAQYCHCQPSQKRTKTHLCLGCKALTICDWLLDGLCTRCVNPRGANATTECASCRRTDPAQCNRALPTCSSCEAKQLECVYTSRNKKTKKRTCIPCRGDPAGCDKSRPRCSLCKSKGIQCFYQKRKLKHPCQTCVDAEDPDGCDKEQGGCSSCKANSVECVYPKIGNKIKKPCQTCIDADDPEGCDMAQPACSSCAANGVECRKSGPVLYMRGLKKALSRDIVFLAKLGSRSARQRATQIRAEAAATKAAFMATHSHSGQDTTDEYLQSSIIHPGKRTISDGFSASIDAQFPVAVVGQGSSAQVFLHHGSNLRLTHRFVNCLKGVFGHLIIRYYSELCKNLPEHEFDEIMQRMYHMHLICAQFPHSVAGRLELDAKTVMRIQDQLRSGFASPEAVATSITAPWRVYSAGNRGRDQEGLPPGADDVFPDMAKVKARIREIEQNSGVSFGNVPYPFNPDTKPKVWRWMDVRSFYAMHLRAMNEWCDQPHSNDRSAQDLLILHCIQYAYPDRFAHGTEFTAGFEWLRRRLSPYLRDPLSASAAHSDHGLEMKTGLDADYAFNIDDCTIVWEPWPWNLMRGCNDEQLETYIRMLRDMPRSNEPLWPTTLPSAPGVPETSHRDQISARQAAAEAIRRRFTLTPPAPSHPPAPQNLSNTQNICYASSTVQVLYHVQPLKTLVVMSKGYPFKVDTGRGSTYLSRRTDLDMKKHMALLNSLRSIFANLDIASTRLGPEHTLRLLQQVNGLARSFPINAEHDSAEFLDALIEIMNASGDRSRNLDDQRPKNDEIDDEHAEAMSHNQVIAPLRDDYLRSWDGHLQTGFRSPATDLLGLQVAQELICATEDCTSRYSRQITVHNSINLTFPLEARTRPTQEYKIEQLLEANDQVADGELHAAADCACDPSHEGKYQYFKRILRLPAVLVMRVERMSLSRLRGFSDQAAIEREAMNPANRISNPLIMGDTLDMAPWCEKHLPSERLREFESEEQLDEWGLSEDEIDDHKLENTCGTEMCYRLMAVMKWHSHHIVAYARIKDEDGYMRWALFDDTSKAPTWQDPFENQGLETTLIYVKLSKAEQKACAAAATGDTEMMSDDDSNEDEFDDTEEEDVEVSAVDALGELDELGGLLDEESEEDEGSDSDSGSDNSDDSDSGSDNSDDSDSDSDSDDDGYDKLGLLERGRLLHKEISGFAHRLEEEADISTVLLHAGRVLQMSKDYDSLVNTTKEADGLRDTVEELTRERDSLRQAVARIGNAPGGDSDPLDTLTSEVQALTEHLDNIRRQTQEAEAELEISRRQAEAAEQRTGFGQQTSLEQILQALPQLSWEELSQAIQAAGQQMMQPRPAGSAGPPVPPTPAPGEPTGRPRSARPTPHRNYMSNTAASENRAQRAHPVKRAEGGRGTGGGRK